MQINYSPTSTILQQVSAHFWKFIYGPSPGVNCSNWSLKPEDQINTNKNSEKPHRKCENSPL